LGIYFARFEVGGVVDEAFNVGGQAIGYTKNFEAFAMCPIWWNSHLMPASVCDFRART
jgi:hypothetical protein